MQVASCISQASCMPLSTAQMLVKEERAGQPRATHRTSDGVWRIIVKVLQRQEEGALSSVCTIVRGPKAVPLNCALSLQKEGDFDENGENDEFAF